MFGVDIHYPIGGIAVLIGSVAFLKLLDFLASQSARRLLEMVEGNGSKMDAA